MKDQSRHAVEPAHTRWPYAIAALCYAAFVVITVLVQIRALAEFDLAAMLDKRLIANPVLDLIGAVTTVLVSAEVSLALALAFAYVLWRLGLGAWSLAPLAFVLLVPAEIAMKFTIDQPGVDEAFRRIPPLNLTVVDTPGAFPSGHALRTGFFCTFLAVLIYALRRDAWRWSAAVLLLLALVIGYSRMYVGDHWLSDVIAGLLLGGGTALLVGWPVAARLLRRRAG